MAELAEKRIKAGETFVEEKTENDRQPCLKGIELGPGTPNGMNAPIQSKTLFGRTSKLDKPSDIAPLPEDVQRILRALTSTGATVSDLELLMDPILSTTQDMLHRTLSLPLKEAPTDVVEHFLRYVLWILLGPNYCKTENRESSSSEIVLTKGFIKDGPMPRIGVDSNIMIQVMTSAEFLENPYWHDLKQYLKKMFNAGVFRFGYVIIACQSHFACIKVAWTGEIYTREIICSISNMDDLAYLKHFIQQADGSAFQLPSFNVDEGKVLVRKSFKVTDVIAFNQGTMIYGVEEGYVVKVRKDLDPLVYDDPNPLFAEYSILRFVTRSYSHPNIIQALSLFTPCMLLSPRGECTIGALRQHHQVDDKEMAKMLLDVLDALHFVHLRDCIHRDIRPENIIYASGRLILIDFGLARILRTWTTTTFEGTLLFGANEHLKVILDRERDFEWRRTHDRESLVKVILWTRPSMTEEHRKMMWGFTHSAGLLLDVRYDATGPSVDASLQALSSLVLEWKQLFREVGWNDDVKDNTFEDVRKVIHAIYPCIQKT